MADDTSGDQDALRIMRALRESGVDPGLPYTLIVARVVSELRKASGLSQEQMAQKVGITQSSLSRIEKGDTVFNADHAIVLAAALGVEPHQIFKIADNAVTWLRKRDLNMVVSATKVAAASILGPGATGLLVGSMVAAAVGGLRRAKGSPSDKS